LSEACKTSKGLWQIKPAGTGMPALFKSNLA
jgi:hypothetical protein